MNVCISYSGEVEVSISDVNHAMDLGGPVVSLLVIRARLKFKLNLLDDAIGSYLLYDIL